jgi:uncharacterized membrane protein HdeD (DUF308 family)
MTDFDAGLTPEPPPSIIVVEEEIDDTGWWLSIIGGLVLLGLGIWMLTNLYDSVVVLAWLVGVSLIIAGLVEILSLHGQKGIGWAVWTAGLLLVAAGVAVIVWHDITLWALAVLAGIGFLIGGVVRIALALSDRDHPDFVLNLAVGALGVVLGVLVLVWPEATLVVLALLLGIRFVVSGIVAIGMGWQLHRLSR